MRLLGVRSLSLVQPAAAMENSVACAADKPKRPLISPTTDATARDAPSPPLASGESSGADCGAEPPPLLAVRGAPAARPSGEPNTFGEHTPEHPPCAGPHSAVSMPIGASK